MAVAGRLREERSDNELEVTSQPKNKRQEEPRGQQMIQSSQTHLEKSLPSFSASEAPGPPGTQPNPFIKISQNYGWVGRWSRSASLSA